MSNTVLKPKRTVADHFQTLLARLSAVTAVAVILAAGGLLFVWLVLPEYKAWAAMQMKSNTALGLLLAGTALWLLRPPADQRTALQRALGRTLSVLVALLGTLTLLEYLGGWNFGIDEILTADFPNAESRLYPGRMSPIAAVCFVLAGLALLAIDRPAQHRYRHPASLLLLPVILFALLALIGYLYGVTSFYRIGPFIRVGLPTAICFGLLAIGILTARAEYGPIRILFSEGPGGYMARRLVPIAVLLPIVLGLARIELQLAGHVDLMLGTALLTIILTLAFYTMIAIVSEKLDDIDAQRYELLNREREAHAQADMERQRLYSMFMQTPVVINILRGPEHVFELQNPASRALVGGRDLTGMTVRDAVPEYEGQGWFELLDRVYAGEAYIGKEMLSRLRQPDGNFIERYFDANYVTWREIDGTVAGIINTAVDVTDQVKARNALRESEELFRSTFNLAAVAMAQVDVDSGRFLRVNSKMEHITGYSAAELERLTFIDITHPDDREQDRARYFEMIANKTQSYSSEKRYIRKDGEVIWGAVNVAAVHDRTGAPIHTVAAILDITAMKASEHTLKKAIQARDEFLSMASHEFQTPLTSLMLQTQSLLRAVSKGDTSVYAPERINKLLEQTEKQVIRLSRLMTDMLDVSRLRTGKLQLEKAATDLGELAQEAVERMRLQLTHAADDALVADIQPLAIGYWDRLRIEQVISNLLTNAVRYGARKPIEVRVERGDKHARLIVKDHGIGIAPHDHERIFNRFERAVSATEVSGLGLGLFITRELVHAHGGRIWVESELGRGATFFVELPLAESDRL